MKNKLRFLAVALLAGGSMFAQTRFSIGVGIGGYTAPPAYAQYRPPCPGPDYTWVDGYWGNQGSHRIWNDGFWRAPAHRVENHYVAPRFDYRHNDRDHGRNFDRDDHRGHR